MTAKATRLLSTNWEGKAVDATIVLNLANHPTLVRVAEAVKSGANFEAEWVEPSDYHVTLIYLPTVPYEEITAMARLLNLFDASDLEIELTGIGAFNNGDSNNLHFRVESDALRKFQKQLYLLAETLGFEISPYGIPEDFIPHVSIAYSDSPFETLPDVRMGQTVAGYGAFLSIGADDGKWEIIGMTKAKAEKLLKTDAGNIEQYHEDNPGDVRYDQPDVDYDPAGGGAGAACSSCRWFDGYNRCHLVKGIIAPNGICEIHEPIANDDNELGEEGEDEAIEAVVEQLVTDGVLGQASVGKAVLEYLKSLLKSTEDSLFDTPSGFKMRGNQWIAWYTNAYRDRDGEWFATKAIEEDIAQMWATRSFPELWYWHIKGTKHGQATWVGMIGRYAVAVGEFDNTPAAKAFKKRYKQQPHQLSHGFVYDPDSKKDGVYYKYHTFEISPLPAGKEANELTAFAIKSGEADMKLTKEQFHELASIVGVDDAIKMVGQGYAATKEADEKVSFKAKAEEDEQPPDEKGDYKALEARMSKMEAMLEKALRKLSEDEETKPEKKEDDKATDPVSEQVKAIAAKQAEFEAFIKGQQSARSVQGWEAILADYHEKQGGQQPAVPQAVEKGVKALMGTTGE